MRKSRFRDRMLVSFLTIITLPVLTLGVMAPILYARNVAAQTAAHTRAMVDRVTTEVESRILHKEKLLRMLLEDEDLREFFSVDTAREETLVRRLRSATATHPEIAGIIAVARDDRFVSDRLSPILRDPLTQEEWFRAAVDSPGAFRLLTRPIGRNLINATGIGVDEIVSIIQPVLPTPDGSASDAGVLMMDLHLGHIEAAFRDARQDQSGFFCILDDRGGFVYAPVNPVVYRINPQWFVDSERIVEKTIGNRGYRFIFSESPYTGWKTVGVYDLEVALGPVRFVQFSALIIALITVALAVVVSMVYTRAISRPVLHLRSVMERAGHGDLTVRYDGHSRDEIDELGQGLNAMLEKIEDLLQLVYREQQSKREAELRIMQQQIKPHFLYNTLDTILWMAEEDQPQEIVEVVTALTRLFRIALSDGREVIPLRDEIDHVNSYLVIQKIRYEEKFRFRVLCPLELSHFGVQKMILQPLVENAIYHGVKEKSGSGIIAVSVEQRDGVLALTVTDDGVGIPEDKLQPIRDGLRHLDHDSDRSAFALYNVNDRIRLTYGDRFGVSVESRVGRGTTVTILHPLLPDGV